MKLLHSTLRGQTNSPYLSSKINIIYVPSRVGRAKGLFLPSGTGTQLLANSPIERMMILYNKLIEIISEIIVFSDTKVKFEGQTMVALARLHL